MWTNLSYSEPSLESSLWLRPRRERSDRPRPPSVKLALISVVAAGVFGFVSSSVNNNAWPAWLEGLGALNARYSSGVDTAPSVGSLDAQRYVDTLWSIHTQLEQSVARVGLGAAFYKNQEIDRAELKTRLAQGLDGYRQAEARVAALQPPARLRAPHEDYLATVRLFQASAIEMLKMYDDGDDSHLSAAVPLSLDGTSRLRELGAELWPGTSPPN